MTLRGALCTTNRTFRAMPGLSMLLEYMFLAQSGFRTVEDGSPRRRAGATLYGFRTTVT